MNHALTNHSKHVVFQPLTVSKLEDTWTFAYMFLYAWQATVTAFLQVLIRPSEHLL